MPAAEYVATIGYEHQLSRPDGPQPLWLTGLDEEQYVRTIDDGKALYVGYHHTFEATDALAQRVLTAGRNPEIRRVIVDVRMNGGGNNQTYRPLLRALASPAVARKAYVLQGRVTFSAAGNFVTEVDLRTKAKIVGEPSGGAPNQWGDNELVELPRAGLTVRVASSYWVFGRGPKDAPRRGAAGPARDDDGGGLLRRPRPCAGACASMSCRIALLAALVMLACASAAGAGRPGAGGDVRAAADLYETSHPAPFHAVTRDRYRATVASLERRAARLTPNELLVELMRLGALPGVRDGHGGIYPLDSAHGRMLHLLPIRLYQFPEGIHVVAEIGRRGLVGDRLVSIAGVPVAEVMRHVRPLVPHDNDWSRDARALQWLLVTEVLHGLGLADSAGSQTLTFAKRDGSRRTVRLARVSSSSYSAAFPDFFNPLVVPGLPRRPAPAYLAGRSRRWYTALLDGGRVAYAAYNVTDSSDTLARELGQLAARPTVRARRGRPAAQSRRRRLHVRPAARPPARAEREQAGTAVRPDRPRHVLCRRALRDRARPLDARDLRR